MKHLFLPSAVIQSCLPVLFRYLAIFVYFFLTGFSFHGISDSKESANKVGDPGLIPGSGRSPREGNGYLLQYSCLEISKDRGAWQGTVHGVRSLTAESDMTEQLNNSPPV